MAYVPPHKRHTKPGDNAPIPVSMNPTRFHTKHTSKSEIVYGDGAISKWFIVGLADDEYSMLSNFARLQPMSTDFLVQRTNAITLKGNDEVGRQISENPWVYVKRDLVLSLLRVKDAIKGDEDGKMKAYLIVRIGKILFYGNHSYNLEYSRGNLERSPKSFYTNVGPAYIQHITNDVVPRIGLEFVDEKDLYQLKLSDNTEPGSIILCKCSVNEEMNSLQLCKIEMNTVRHFVADMSCLDSDLDLRLTVRTKRKSFVITDEQLDNIKRLISCATLDQETRGGLSWPFGKQSLDRYTVVAVWHTNTMAFRNSWMKLKIRVADRHDLKTSEGEVTREISFKMPKILSQLVDEEIDNGLALEMLKENLEIIWKNFLCLRPLT